MGVFFFYYSASRTLLFVYFIITMSSSAFQFKGLNLKMALQLSMKLRLIDNEN